MSYPEIRALVLDASFDDLLPLALKVMPDSWSESGGGGGWLLMPALILGLFWKVELIYSLVPVSNEGRSEAENADWINLMITDNKGSGLI